MTRKLKTKRPQDHDVSITRSSAVEYLTFVNVRTVNEHLKKIFSDNELTEDSVIRKFRITASDGKNYDTQHYSLSAIIAVGYKVNSERAVDREILSDAGKVTAEIAKAHAESEFEKYRIVQDRLYVSDFDADVSEGT